MDNAIHVYKDTSLSKSGAFNLKDTVKNVVTIDGEVVTSSAVEYEEVTSPTGNPSTSGYYEFVNGKYVPSEDTEVDSSKTYYVVKS